jgi:hypothetical protein
MTPRDGYDDRRESWRRIRVGLTGLGGILLIIGLASAMLERIGPKASPVEATRNGEAAKSAETKNEPLAELGVAPGAAAPADEGSAPKK